MLKRIPVLLFAYFLLLGVGVEVQAVGTSAGTNITNTASVDYQDGNGNTLMSTSNTVTTVVSQVASVQTAPDNALNATPGDTLYYSHTVTNLGNGKDVFDLTAASTQSWSTTFYRDVNGNGLFDGGDTPLVDSNANVTVDTDSIAANDSLQILVRLIVPTGVADATIDVTTVTATSAFDNTKAENATDTTTVASPSIGVVKSVAPAGAQPPGTTLTYTMVITNSGTSAASNVIMTDNIPVNTTYVASSITQDTVPKTDGGGDDNADHNVTAPGSITVSVGALGASGGLTTITFKVTID